MWQEKTALTTIESYFRKDERFQLVQKLPWYYALSAAYLLSVFAFLVFGALLFLLCSPLPTLVLLLLFLAFCAFLYYGVTRSVYGNYTVFSQFSVYRFIDKQIPQIDEFPLSKAKSITVAQLWFAPQYASVTIRCHSSYAKEMPSLKRMYSLKTVQRNPEKADMRSLSLGKPIRLRLVCRNPRETYTILSDIKTLMGYSYVLYAKGRKHGNRKKSDRRAS